MPSSSQYLQLFAEPADEAWAFAGQKSTNRFTHGYHRYPAKFLPNLVKKLIEEYTTEEDLVADVFAGCGTTLVESKIHGRKSIGVDINPVARMITTAKITPIDPELLESHSKKFVSKFAEFKSAKRYYPLKKHPRIDYWFREKEKNKLAFLHRRIRYVREPDIRAFYLCALSNILKPCSRWLQSGTKPQLDPSRDNNISDPFERFSFQIRQMKKQNKAFFDELQALGLVDTHCEIRDANATKTGIKSGTVGAVITSPPYVTSYEYADIHQLTGYWFDYFRSLAEFRKSFIGTFYSQTEHQEPEAPIAKAIVANLQSRSAKYAREVAKYFVDMASVADEIRRILKPNGIACIVIGNTTLKDVEINSAQAFSEMLFEKGFKIEKVIKRQVTNKLNPTIRDKESGRFTTMDSKNRKDVYPDEYIVIARKYTHK